ncbi:fluoride efflux transporter FluC [Senegalimassilia anaerobia]
MRGNIPDAVDHALRSPRSLAPLVLVMGFLGATARYALEMLLPAQCGFPVATLAVNIFGCFTLEIVNQFVARRTSLPAPLVKSMGIGLIGAFTTIAALSTENLALLQQGRFGMLALYLGITVLATFGAAYAGKRLADAMGPRYSAHHRAAAAATDSPQNESGAQ